MPCCCAVGCNNRADKGFRLFRFPADASRRKIWLAKLRRDHWEPTTSSRLCEAHFDSSQFENNRMDGRRLLKPFAVPEIFPHRPMKTPRKPPTKRETLSQPPTKREALSQRTELNTNEAVPSCHEDITMVLEGEENVPEDLLGDVSNENDEADKDEIIRRLKLKISAGFITYLELVIIDV